MISTFIRHSEIWWKTHCRAHINTDFQSLWKIAKKVVAGLFIFSMVGFFFLYLSIPKPVPPSTSLIGERGFLNVYGNIDSHDPYANQRLIKFNDQDYLALGIYVLYANECAENSLNKQFTIQTGKYTFITATGYGKDLLEMKQFAIAYDENHNGTLLDTHDFVSFSRSYNSLINDSKISINLQDQDLAKRYIAFIMTLAKPVAQYDAIDLNQLSYVREKKMLHINHNASIYYIMNVSGKRYEEICRNFKHSEFVFSPDEGHARYTFTALDLCELKEGKCKIDVINISIFGDGKIDLKANPICRLPEEKI